MKHSLLKILLCWHFQRSNKKQWSKLYLWLNVCNPFGVLFGRSWIYHYHQQSVRTFEYSLASYPGHCLLITYTVSVFQWKRQSIYFIGFSCTYHASGKHFKCKVQCPFVCILFLITSVWSCPSMSYLSYFLMLLCCAPCTWHCHSLSSCWSE